MRKGGQDSRDLVVDILANSFDANPSVNYIVKHDRHRRERIRKLMQYSFNVCDAFGEIWLSDNEDACALVLFPDKKKATLASILWDVELATSVIGLGRIVAVLDREARIKKLHPNDRFAYLWFIGVKPELHGQGVGGTLPDELIGRYRLEKRPIYFETSVDKNLTWYGKHRFEIFETITLTYPLFFLRKNFD